MIARGRRYFREICQVHSYSIWLAIALLVLVSQFRVTKASDSELSHFLQRHLDSIGTPKALDAVRFRVARGIFRGSDNVLKPRGHGTGLIYGTVEFSAGPDSLRLTIQCDSPRYSEGFFTDTEKVRTAILDGRERGWLGEFLENSEKYVTGGLIGGVLSTAWPLLTPAVVQKLLKSKGQEELDGTKLLAFDYSLGERERVVLYFDPKTFRHMATKCTAEIRGSYWTLVERFSVFRKSDGMNLPVQWTLTLHAPRDTLVWNFTFDKITHAEGPALKRTALPGQ